MTDSKLNSWKDTLRAFNERNMARAVDMELIAEDVGAQSEVRGLNFNGVAFDRHDDGVEIMLGGRPGYHITHAIGGVKSIDMLSADLPLTDVLRIHHEGGQTILTASQSRVGASCGIREAL